MRKVASYYGDKLSNIRYEILGEITALIKKLGGRICARYYHDGEPDLTRNAYFEVDDDGYGRELFLDTIYTEENGELGFIMHNNDDTYCPYWELSDFNASNAYYLLTELEEIAEYVEVNHEEVVKDWEPDLN